MKLRITIMGHLKGEQIDFLLGYYVLITLANLKYKSLQIYKIRLEEGSLRSLHHLVGSLNHLAGPAEGSTALFIRPPQWLHSLPGGILEAFAGSASQKDIVELVRRGLLNGGISTTTIIILRR